MKALQFRDPSHLSKMLDYLQKVTHYIFSLLATFFHPLLFLFPLSGLKQFIQLLHLFHCACLYFFKGLMQFFFKDIYHLHKIGFKIIFLFFSCVRISGACCNRIAGFQWYCYIVQAVVDCVLMLTSSHLGLD